MPIHQLHISTKTCSYLVWHIDESEEKLYSKAILTPAENHLYNSLSHPKRRIEWLASRIAYQELCHYLEIPYKPLQKDHRGRPYLDDQLCVSLSHGFPFTVAAIHFQYPIGVDIQIPHPKLQVVQKRYLTPTEMAHSQNDLTKLCLYWCAKEAIYKAHNPSPLTSQDIDISPFETKEQGTLYAQVLTTHPYVVYYQLTPAYVLAWGYKYSSR